MIFIIAFTLLYGWNALAKVPPACENLFATASFIKTSIDIRSVRHKSSERLLSNAVVSMLTLSKAHFFIPDTILMVNSGGFPSSKDDVITIRFPYFEVFGSFKVRKTAQDSLGINLHELGHQILEASIKKWYENEPEIIWAFFTRLDGVAALDSLDHIESSKVLTKYITKSNKYIQKKFAAYVPIATAYNELFADTITAFTLRGPDAIYRSLNFKKYLPYFDGIDQKFQADHEYRRFNQIHIYDNARMSLENGPYNVFASTRNFIWREIFVKYLANNPQVSEGEVLMRIAQAMVDSLRQITNNFETSPHEISGIEMNRHLQLELSKLLDQVTVSK